MLIRKIPKPICNTFLAFFWSNKSRKPNTTRNRNISQNFDIPGIKFNESNRKITPKDINMNEMNLFCNMLKSR